MSIYERWMEADIIIEDCRSESCFTPQEKGYVPLLSCQLSADKCIRIHGLSASETLAEVTFWIVMQRRLARLEKSVGWPGAIPDTAGAVVSSVLELCKYPYPE